MVPRFLPRCLPTNRSCVKSASDDAGAIPDSGAVRLHGLRCRRHPGSGLRTSDSTIQMHGTRICRSFLSVPFEAFLDAILKPAFHCRCASPCLTIQTADSREVGQPFSRDNWIMSRRPPASMARWCRQDGTRVPPIVQKECSRTAIITPTSSIRSSPSRPDKQV